MIFLFIILKNNKLVPALLLLFFLSNQFIIDCSVIKNFVLSFLLLITKVEQNLYVLVLYILIISRSAFFSLFFLYYFILSLLIKNHIYIQDLNIYNSYEQLNLKLINGLFFIHPQLLYVSYVTLLFITLVFIKKYIQLFLYKINKETLLYTNSINGNVKNYINYFGAILFTAIILGSWWAQQELDWGGWWNWDFVELISFILFFVFYFFTHSIKKYELIANCSWAFFYILLFFIITTRYNIFPSIHNFLGIIHINIWSFLLLQFVSLYLIFYLIFSNNYYVRLKTIKILLNFSLLYPLVLVVFFISTFFISIFFSFFWQNNFISPHFFFKPFLVLWFSTLIIQSSFSNILSIILFFVSPLLVLFYNLFLLINNYIIKNWVFHFFLFIFLNFYFTNNFKDDIYITYDSIFKDKYNNLLLKLDYLDIMCDYGFNSNKSLLKNIHLNYSSFLHEPERIDDGFYTAKNSVYSYFVENNLYLLTTLNIFFIIIIILTLLLIKFLRVNRRIEL